MASGEDLHKAGAEVHGKEKNSPPLILPDMHAFVCAASGQNVVVNADDDMAKGNRLEAKGGRQSQDKIGYAATRHFQRPIDHKAGRAGHTSDQRKKRSDHCGGRYPEVYESRSKLLCHGRGQKKGRESLECSSYIMPEPIWDFIQC